MSLADELMERWITDDMPSQKHIASVIQKSKENFETSGLFSSIRKLERLDSLSCVHFAALVHSHFGALQFLAGKENPRAFDADVYRKIVREAKIGKILEIGPEYRPLAHVLQGFIDSDSVEITYLGTSWPKGTPGRKICGYFPEDLPAGENFDFIFACGVFSPGGQRLGYDATGDLESIARTLSANQFSVGINMTQENPTMIFDEKRLRKGGNLLYVNNPQLFYLNRDRFSGNLGEHLATDLVVLKKYSK